MNIMMYVFPKALEFGIVRVTCCCSLNAKSVLVWLEHMSYGNSVTPVDRFGSLPFVHFLLTLTLLSFTSSGRDNSDSQYSLKTYCAADTFGMYFLGVFFCDS